MAIRDEDVGWKPRSQNAESREALAPKGGRNPCGNKINKQVSEMNIWDDDIDIDIVAKLEI